MPTPQHQFPQGVAEPLHGKPLALRCENRTQALLQRPIPDHRGERAGPFRGIAKAQFPAATYNLHRAAGIVHERNAAGANHFRHADSEVLVLHGVDPIAMHGHLAGQLVAGETRGRGTIAVWRPRR